MDLIKAVVSSPSHHDTLCIVSNANDIVMMTYKTYMQTARNDMWCAAHTLAEHIKNKGVSKHLILFGSDVNMFEDAPFPSHYRWMQEDILNMLSYVGLTAGTGMDCHYGGGFGQFRGKLDHAWHIQGCYRWEAEQWLEGVLKTVDPTRQPAEASSSLSVHSTQASSSLSVHSTHASSTLSVHVLQHMNLKQNPKKRYWIDVGHDRGYKWPRCYEIQSCNEVVCPVDEGGVLVCTSGDPKTEAQTHLTCQMLHSLGWKPHIIVGVGQEDMPPKGWKVGCKATFAWYVSLMPQILACAEALGNEECLMVAEDSLWPSHLLTPQLVYEKLARRKKALWLAALMPPKEYKHVLGDIDISARAPAGSKCFCGNKDFWRNVDFLFDVTDKNWSTDAIFQTMVGLCELDLVHPFLGATMPHVSMRTGHVSSHGLAAANIAGTLLPLPSGWKKSLGPMMASGKIFEC